MKCSKHPRYKVMRKPSSNCEGCWYLWTHNKRFEIKAYYLVEDYYYPRGDDD